MKTPHGSMSSTALRNMTLHLAAPCRAFPRLNIIILDFRSPSTLGNRSLALSPLVALNVPAGFLSIAQ